MIWQKGFRKFDQWLAFTYIFRSAKSNAVIVIFTLAQPLKRIERR